MAGALSRGDERLIELLDEVLNRVIRIARPDRVLLFGSAARGEFGPDSDLDLLVVKSGVPHRGRLAEEIYLGLFGIPVPVDIIVATPEDFEEYTHTVGNVFKAIARDAVELYAA